MERDLESDPADHAAEELAPIPLTQEEYIDFAELKATRGRCRAQLTRLQTSLRAMNNTNKLTENEVEKALINIEDIRRHLSELDSKLSRLVIRSYPKEFNAMVDRAFAYDRLASDLIVDLKIIYRNRFEQNQPEVISAKADNAFRAVMTQDQSSKIPIFNGDVKKYREWKQLFDVYVHKADLPVIEKSKF